MTPTAHSLGYDPIARVDSTAWTFIEPHHSAGRPCQWAEGWAADQAWIVLPDGAEIPLRIPAVFRNETTAWKIVTAHLSLGVPDAKLTDLLPQLLN